MPFKTKEAEREWRRGYFARNADRIRARKRAAARARREAQGDEFKSRQSEWNAKNYAKNKERIAAKKRAAYAQSPELHKERARAQRVKHRDAIAQRAAAKCRANPSFYAAVSAARRAAKARATPVWADLGTMQDEYEAAQFLTEWTGMKWHVDHIVPLRSKLVCGLHCPANLQLLPETENVRKGNRWWPDMPEPRSGIA